MALWDAYDIMLLIKTDIYNTILEEAWLEMYTDCLSKYNILTRATIYVEKRFLSNLFCVRNAYENDDINNDFSTSSEHNLTNALTNKRKTFSVAQYSQGGRRAPSCGTEN